MDKKPVKIESRVLSEVNIFLKEQEGILDRWYYRQACDFVTVATQNFLKAEKKKAKYRGSLHKKPNPAY